jgi:parallel beta-helix repeat protein
MERGALRKLFLNVFAIAILLSSIFLVTSTATGDTNVTISINSDTTWTKLNSPYTLTQPISISDHVTLTIEPGVTINMNGYDLLVNGVLVAKGSSNEKINFKQGDILLGASASGSIIENSILNSTNLSVNCTATINSNYILGEASATSFEAVLIGGGSPIISNNTIFAADRQRSIHIVAGSPTITSNAIMGLIISDETEGAPILSHNTVEGGILFQRGGTPVVSNNLITGFKYVNFNGDIDALVKTVSNQDITGGIIFIGDYSNALHDAVVTDNVVTGCLTGISVLEGGTTTVERNFITNNSREGIYLGSTSIVTGNTISNNEKGISISNAGTKTITNNNILNNGQWNIYAYCGDIVATNNWWGTTDTQAIGNAIYDNKFDPNLGAISITPILTASNPAAYPNAITFPSINMPTTQGTDTNPFHIGSNSTVTDVAFDSTNATLSFTVSGPSGTAGYATVTIDKTLMPNGGDLKVYLDGNQLSYQLATSDNSWILTFAYTHSTHHVSIYTTATQIEATTTPLVTPTPSVDEYYFWFLPLTFLAIASIGGLIVWSRKKKS